MVVSIPLLFADEETHSDAQSTSAIQGIAKGVKEAVYEGPKELVEETVKETPKKPAFIAMIQGLNEGTKKFLDHTLKGIYRVATLGKSELKDYEVEEPKKGSNEPTKIKISIPGT